MREQIKLAIDKINELSKNKPIKVISHFDTDGITSAAIFSKSLQRWGKKFSLKIVKNLTQEIIENLPESHILIFLDLASGSIEHLEKKKTEVFILDHHEIPKEHSENMPSNITMIHPLLFDKENYSGAAVCYLFAKTLSEENKDLSNLAVLGMVGDQFDKHIGKVFNEILNDAQTIIKTGLLLYPSTRPIDRVLEYSTSLYIPGVTGSFKGVFELLKEAGIEKTEKGHKSLSELNKEEMSRLVTAVLLRRKEKSSNQEIIGNIYLIKLFNKLEDAREISALVNSCSRSGNSDIALSFCLGDKNSKKEAQKTYNKHRQNISSALKHIEETEKLTGNNYTIINAKDKIKDTVIGTVASIMSYSPIYPEGTIIIAMAYDNDKIKVSARLSGKKGRNVREILKKATIQLSSEVGGHPNAAGCLISKTQEDQFIKELKNTLDIEVIKA